MTRILFVDDEPNILDGLRQSLRRKRKVWDMVFIESSVNALEYLEREPVDIIVSDMRMPLMDGAELLKRVAKIRPQTARIVLSGQMDEASAMRAACVAHRFLLKPCDSEVLEMSITKTLELRALLQSDEIKACVSGTAKLPSLPEACLALNQALTNDQAPLEAVVKIVETDVGMASKILQLVNSSFFGLMRPIASISQAVSYLGLNTIRHLVFVQAMFEEFRGTDIAYFEREQSRLLLCARIARQLIADKKQADAASTAALLHDVGILVMANRMPNEHQKNCDLATSQRVPLHVAERQRLGTTHAEIGAYLLGLWGLPYDVIDPVARHHAPWQDVQELDICAAVRLADVLVSEATSHEGEATLHCEPPPRELLERLAIAKVVEALSAQVRSASLLDVRSATGP